MDCIICKIINREIPGNIVYEDDEILAFHDISPKAPVHVLIVPKTHLESVSKIEIQHFTTIGRLQQVASKIAEELGIAESGYRLVTNTGVDGGQTINHLHYHLLGGRTLTWPPG